MATTTHQITCAADDFCPAYSITGFFQSTTSTERATTHRRKLAADGWTDHEGRDYCPEHKPQAAPTTEETTR
jgi:hypothetical protein